MGALLVAVPAFRAIGRRRAPVLADRFHLPTRRALDVELIDGAAVFGFGWGLVGLCPGPALAALGLGVWRPAVFVLAMLAGMALYRFIRPAANGPLAPFSATGRGGGR